MPKRHKPIASIGSTDYLFADEYCVGHLIDLPTLEKHAGDDYLPPVRAALFAAFVELRDAKDRGLRLADFPVYIGDHFNSNGSFFIVGISDRVTSEANATISRHLIHVPGYLSAEMVRATAVSIVPWWRYAKGKVYCYVNPPRKTTIDEATGLAVIGRGREYAKT